MLPTIKMQPIKESDNEEELTRESSGSIGSRIDDLEELLERKLRVNRGTSRIMRCVGGLLKIILNWLIWLMNKEHKE